MPESRALCVNNVNLSAKWLLLTGVEELPVGGGTRVGRRLLVDTVVHQQLGDQRGEEGDGDPKPKATS